MAQECVQHHPLNALEAWSGVVAFDATSGTSKYLDEWRGQNAFLGLQHGKMKPGTITLDPDTLHPASIRDQFTINKFLDTIPDEKSAHDQACVKIYDEH